MKCPHCNNEIADNSLECSYCHTLLVDEDTQISLSTSESLINEESSLSLSKSTISKTPNKILMKQARELLRGKWNLAARTILLYFVILLLIQMIPQLSFVMRLDAILTTITTLIGVVINIFFYVPLGLGLTIFFLSILRSKPHYTSQIFAGFHRWCTAVGAYFLIALFTILWSLLLIIPGIIAILSYSMTFYILADNENIGARDAVRESKRIMKGNRWKFFCLGLRFMGWFLLGILSIGIGFLWITPYYMMSMTKFYQDIIESSSLDAA